MTSLTHHLRILRPVLVILAAISGAVISAQSVGEVDTAFNADDIGNRAGYHIGGVAMALEIQPDGRILCAARNQEGVAYDHHQTGGVFRLFPNGTLDPSFSTLGASAPNTRINSITLQPDGKLLVSSPDLDAFDGFPCHDLIRLHIDGTFDTTFRSPLVTSTGAINDASMLPDGKILIVGSFESINGIAHHGIARLFPDGVLDDSFQSAGLGEYAHIAAVHVEETGSLLIGGRFSSIGDHACGSFARLQADGTVDASVLFPAFNDHDHSPGTVNNIAVLSDGRIAVSGFFDRVDSTLQESTALLLPNGTVDITFEVGSAFNANCCATTSIKDMVVDVNDRLYLVGNFTHYQGNVVSGIIRLLPNGAQDPLFNVRLGVNYGYQPDVYAVGLASTGGIIAIGDINTYGDVLTRNIVHVLEGGEPDLDFDPGTGANSDVLALARQEDGRLLVGGTFSHFNGAFGLYLTRLHADGTLDETFQPPAWSRGSVSSIDVLDDGRILCGGSFRGIGAGTAPVGLVRLFPDGSLDSTFHMYAHPWSSVRDIAVQDDGRIIVAGWMTHYHGTPRSLITRLLPNGELDEAFVTAPQGFTDDGVPAYPPGEYFVHGPYLESILLQPDGKILVAGVFSSYGGMARNRIARLNTDGSIDPTFDAGLHFTSTNAFLGPLEMSLEANGDILIAGHFDNASSPDRDDIVRLTPYGQIDPTFDTDLVTSGVSDFVKLTDGSIIVVGRTSTPNMGTNIHRLLPNGQVDPGFRTEEWHIGSRSHNDHSCLLDDQNGGLLLGGGFTAFDGVGRNNLVRVLLPDAPTSTEPVIQTTSGVIYPNPVLGGQLHFDLGSDRVARTVMRNTTGAIILDTRTPRLTATGTIDVAGIESGIYSITFHGTGIPSTHRLVITK